MSNINGARSDVFIGAKAGIKPAEITPTPPPDPDPDPPEDETIFVRLLESGQMRITETGGVLAPELADELEALD